jgi:hypothetical protein
MTTVIANDRIGRFAELDRTVLEEVQAIMEVPPADESNAAGAMTGRTRGWLRATLNALRPARAS